MIYDNRHRTFLQAVMQRGAIFDEDASILTIKIFNERLDVSTLAELINEKLSPLCMEMKSGFCEVTCDKYWSVVSTTYEESIMMPSQYSTAERAFLRDIYAELINSDNGCITSTECLNLCNSIESKLSVGIADQFLKDLVSKKWLCLKDGCYYMGVRSVLELMPYFKMTYQDNFHNCFLCKQILFHGYKCSHCDKIYHQYCLIRYLKAQKSNKCPECKKFVDIEIPRDFIEAQVENDSDEPMDTSDNVNISQASTSKTLSTSRKTKKRTRPH